MSSRSREICVIVVEPTLYIAIPKVYTPKGSREEDYLLATKKRSFLLSKRAATPKNLNTGVFKINEVESIRNTVGQI